MKIERVKLIHNFNPKTLELKGRIQTKLNKYGLREDNYNPQLVIAIGGDGTFLKALNKTNYSSNLMYIGINTGHLGFLQEINDNEIDELFKRITTGDYTVETLPVQDINIISGRNRILYRSLNEIVIREQSLRAIELTVSLNGNLLQEFKGDGLMISTSTGSTAHNMSYGGAIMFPNMEALQLLPIAPLQKSKHFSTINNGLILPKGITIEIEPNNYFKNNLLINIDGEYYPFNFKIHKIEIKVANDGINVLKIKNIPFPTKLNEKYIKLM